MTERSEIRGREIKGVRKDRAEGCKQTRTTGPWERERDRVGEVTFEKELSYNYSYVLLGEELGNFSYFSYSYSTIEI